MASSYQAAAANADRVMEILEATPDIQDSPDAVGARLKGDVVFENVQFGYDPSRPVLRGVSLHARPGETVALVGSTGAGKTTLVNLLVRFADPQVGRVTIDSLDVRTIEVRSLREQISMVLQDPFIFPISIADNIAYGRPDATRDDIIAAATAARADSFIRSLPGGYETVVSERGTSLSGGEKQRLSIARAFLKNAPILILDEPTSALDAHTETALLEALKDLMKRRVTFVIAHRLSTIRDADQILVLDHGHIIERGTHHELLAKNKAYAALYGSQQRGAPLTNGDGARAKRPRRRRPLVAPRPADAGGERVRKRDGLS
jgi:ATP-binding cassette subfamily B protein/subfamily B ATP-binding cassette protein MsbA